MKVAVSGASGLIGSAVIPALLEGGHDIVRLVRRAARTPDEVSWDPAAGTIDADLLQGVEAAVHLSGASIGGRPWTASYKRVIWDSRVLSTRTVSDALARLEPKPRVLVCASGVDYYRDSDEPQNESSAGGTGFLADLAKAWEGAADPARRAGIRVVHSRNGLVVASKGGAFGPLFRIFRLGLGGRLGSGRQYWSFISLEDEVRAVIYLLEHDEMSGPVNATAPNAVTNAELTTALAHAVRRPALVTVPAPVLRTALGGLAEVLLSSHRIVPAKLGNAGFEFRDPTIDQALRAALTPDRSVG
jgi:uncharacterized protein (TIGR01777 family)